MTSDGNEFERLRGRLEALLISVGEECGKLAGTLGEPPDPNATALEKINHLGGLVHANTAFSEVEHLVAEGRRLLSMYSLQPPTVVDVVRQMLDGAFSVIGGLERIRLTLAMNMAANERLAEMQAQTGGQAQLSFDQQLAMASNDLELMRISADGQNTLLNAVITLAGSAIRGLLLLNGGAAIAMLAFVGHLVTAENGNVDGAKKFFPAFLCFGYGSAAAVVVGLLAYVAQVCFQASHGKDSRRFYFTAEILRMAAIGFAIFSLGAFVRGLHLAVNAFDPIVTP